MRYNMISSGNIDNTDSSYIYIFPTDFKNSSYLIIYPELKPKDILSGKIKIQSFGNFHKSSITEIKATLKLKLQKNLEIYSDRINTFFTLGTGAFIVGIVNCIIPDPLPFIDEILFIIGGGFTAWKSWNERKRKLPLLSNQIYRFAYEGKVLEVETSPALTSIYRGIRCKIDPETAEETLEGLDAIDIDCLWMTKYINKEEILSSINSDYHKTVKLIKILGKVLSLKKILKMQKQKQTPKIIKNLLILQNEIIKKTGISKTALTVYTEFFRIFTSTSP